MDHQQEKYVYEQNKKLERENMALAIKNLLDLHADYLDHENLADLITDHLTMEGYAANITEN